MDKIVSSVSKPPKARRDDDFTDRLSSRYTVMMLIVFAGVISISYWVGKPIYCWVPKHFTKGWTTYANSFCWVNNTYYLPFSEYIPREGDPRHHITYYQWIPWIFLSQAFFFYVPSLIWHSFNSKAGIDSDDILQRACKLQDMKLAERREQTIGLLGLSIDRFLRSKSAGGKKMNCCKKECSCGGRTWSSYLIVLYMISKVAYLLNVILQMLVLGSLFQTKFEAFGVDYFKMYNPNTTSTYTGQFINSIIFPRVTMCDFNVRLMGNVQRYTVQCALPLNLYVEKMYLFFWFWLVFLIICTGGTLIIWIFRVIIPADKRNFVKNHLLAGNFIKEDDEHYMVYEFVDEYLRQDGCFLLRMIAHNTSTITTADITGHLYQEWQKRDELEGVVVDDEEEEEEEEEEEALITPGMTPDNSEETELEPEMKEKHPIPDTPPSEVDETKPVPVNV